MATGAKKPQLPTGDAPVCFGCGRNRVAAKGELCRWCKRLLAEAWGLNDQVTALLARRRATRARHVWAKVVHRRDGSRHLEVRYSFV